jgi:hypothetical protein
VALLHSYVLLEGLPHLRKAFADRGQLLNCAGRIKVRSTTLHKKIDNVAVNDESAVTPPVIAQMVDELRQQVFLAKYPMPHGATHVQV